MNDPPHETVEVKSTEHLLGLFLEAKKTQDREVKPTTMMRLSASGGCTRKAIFTKLDPTPEDLSARSLSIFELGDALHAMERGDLLRFGLPLKQVEEKVTLHVPAGPLLHSGDEPAPEGEGLDIPGHIDGVTTIGGEDVLLDVKTMNDNSFKRLQREGISDEYRAQLNSYLHALGLKRAILWCYSKNDSSRTLVEYHYDPELQEKIFTHFRTVHHYREGQPLPPPSYLPYDQMRLRKPTGLSVLHYKCSYCPFHAKCWPDYEQDQTTDKPKFILDTLAADLDAALANL